MVFARAVGCCIVLGHVSIWAATKDSPVFDKGEKDDFQIRHVDEGRAPSDQLRRGRTRRGDEFPRKCEPLLAHETRWDSRCS